MVNVSPNRRPAAPAAHNFRFDCQAERMYILGQQYGVPNFGWVWQPVERERVTVVTITENAAKAVWAVMAEEKLSPEDTFLRVAVKGGGCSGLSYDLGFDKEKRVGDVIVEKDGIRLIIDLRSQVYLAGTTLDYTSGLSGRGFFFSNPNASGTCGCGNSFSV